MNKKELDKFGKGVGLLIAACTFIEIGGDIVKENHKFYKKKNKQLLNNLINSNLDLIEQRELLFNLLSSEKVLQESSKILNYELDKESIEDLYTTEQKLLSNFIYLYLNLKSDTELIDTFIITEELRKGKKVYTQVELNDKLKQYEQN